MYEQKTDEVEKKNLAKVSGGGDPGNATDPGAKIFALDGNGKEQVKPGTTNYILR